MKSLIQYITVLAMTVGLLVGCAVDDSIDQNAELSPMNDATQGMQHWAFEASWSGEQSVVDTATIGLYVNATLTSVEVSHLPCEWLLTRCGLADTNGKDGVSVTPTAFKATAISEGYAQGGDNSRYAGTFYYSLQPQTYGFEAKAGQKGYHVEGELKDMNLVVTAGRNGIGEGRVSMVANFRKMTWQSDGGQTTKEWDADQTIVLNSTKRK